MAGEAKSYFLHGQDYHCQPCSLDGVYNHVTGYCVNCQEYLCHDCYTVHCVPTPTRDHVLVDRDREELAWPTAGDSFTENCAMHQGGQLQYYCQSHDVLACQDCKNLAHKNCQGILYIPRISTNILESEEFTTLDNTVSMIDRKCREIMDVSKANLFKRKSNDRALLEDVRRAKDELISKFDELENHLIGQIKQTNTSESSNLKSVASKAKVFLDLNKQIMREIKICKSTSQNSRLYRGMRSTLKILPWIQNGIKSLDDDNTTPIYRFQAKRQLRSLVDNVENLGELLREPEETRATFESYLDVETPTDTKTCQITKALISGTNLILADYSNAKIKAFNTETNKFLAEIFLESAPWDITEANIGHFVATQPKALKLVSLKLWNQKLSFTGEIGVKNECYGIAYKNSRLLVTTINPGQLQILDLKGNIVQVFELDQTGCRLFNRPEFVTVSEFSLPVYIYVADSGNETLTCLTQDGTVVSVYENDMLNGPDKIVVDSAGHTHGSVYVIGSNYQNIAMVTARCGRMKLLLCQGNEKEMFLPKVLCYHETTGRLWIHQTLTNTVTQYKLS